ncbi:MAG TPA: hypothetical protein VGP63_29165 [Planctomycetaceae bacterium]|nr:hypothetical protein [Planctomycetaceae bacterium]
MGKGWDFIAGAWECIPSKPEVPIVKRAEFCHSSWNCGPLLDTLVGDDSHGLHPRFARLQVDSGDQNYTVNLYDIDYRNWAVRCIWQGSRLSAFGVVDDSIFVRNADDWLLVNASSGRLSREIPFVPLATDGEFWLVRKPGETEGCWTYDRRKRQYVAHFGHVDALTADDYSESKLSSDGKCRALVLATPPDNWRGGSLTGRLILQRHGEKKDISIPIELQAYAGSGVAVIVEGVQLAFAPEGNLQLRAWAGLKVPKDHVWTIDIATGKVTSTLAPHSDPADECVKLDGVPVPDYLRYDVRVFRHFGRTGLSPAFLMHSGILKQKPEYPDCVAGVSPDGRHVLYKAHHGPLAGVLIYGDVFTKKTVRWEWPDMLRECNAMEIVWVETPAGAEPGAAPQRRGR